MTKQDEAIVILQRTNDGAELTADELLLVENVVNGRRLTEYGIKQWEILTDKYLTERTRTMGEVNQFKKKAKIIKQLAETRRDALELLEELVGEFPGLLDGETTVSGSYLIEFLTRALTERAVGQHFK